MLRLRTLLPVLAFSCVSLGAPATVRASGPSTTTRPITAGARYSSAPSMNAPSARTGREGSFGIGRLRFFLGRKQVSVERTNDGKRVDESRTRGVAFISKPARDGSVTAVGFMKTRWSSTSQGESSTTSYRGASTLKGSTTRTAWSADRKEGSRTVPTAHGTQTLVRERTVERTIQTPLGTQRNPSAPRTAWSTLTFEPHRQVSTLVSLKQSPTNPDWNEIRTTTKHDATTGQKTVKSAIVSKFDGRHSTREGVIYDN